MDLFTCYYGYSYILVLQVRGFLEKNRDTFSNDLIALVDTSKNPFLNEIFATDKNLVCDSTRIKFFSSPLVFT